MFDSYEDSGNDLVAVEGKILASTARAILFDDGDTKDWLPRSQVSGLPKPIMEDEVVSLYIPMWLAEEKGF